ncbi:MAG: esterase-like activity of phytase family protein, partial [Curvibacter sp.]
MKFPRYTPPSGAGGLSRRQWLKWSAAPVLASALPGCAPLGLRPGNAGLRPQLRLLGEERLPYHLKFKDTTVGGLSGLDRDPVSGHWYALSDDRSDRNPARFYTLAMKVSEAGITGLTVQDVTLLRDAQGHPYPNRKQSDASRPDIPDPESIRFRPETGTLLWTSEGDVNRGLPPAVREMGLDGRLLREFSLPEVLKLGADDMHGPRNNLTFEGLALSPSGRHAWVSMEAQLAQDGPLP